MISIGAKNFAKFATRATPKHSLKAFSSRQSQKGFAFGSSPSSIPSLANVLPTIPASMSNSGTGLGIPATLFARCMSVHTGKTANLEELDESMASMVEEPLGLGSIAEATEDLEAILSKIGSSRIAEGTGISVIVDFHAHWCGPCRVLGPILKKEISENKSAILITVDVDEAPNVAEKFEVTSLPTVKAFKNGKVVDEFIGSRDKAFVKQFIKNVNEKK